MKAAWTKFKRLLLGRNHTPEFVARGAAVGLFIGFTPTTGFQIPILMALRALAGRRWGFHLPLAMLCTLPTNALTIPFLYYGYVVTGRLMLGRFENLRGFDMFNARFSNAADTPGSWVEHAWTMMWAIAAEFGVPLLLGSLPWAVLIACVGYVLTLRYLRRVRVQRHDNRRSGRRSQKDETS